MEALKCTRSGLDLGGIVTQKHTAEALFFLCFFNARV